MKENHPTRDECLKLLKEYNTPIHVINHCKAVAHVAMVMGNELNRNGFKLNLDLIQGAGLLHDIARVEDEHWKIGSKIAESLGYTQEAHIIGVHMTYSPFSSIESINETDLVCLGDRVIKEDAYVGLDERMEYIIQKAKNKGHKDAIARILEKKKEAEGLIDGIEKTIGMSLDELMKAKDKL
ncbi:MAG: HDIG domain-containing protein [Anaerovoracaceae bacterium]